MDNAIEACNKLKSENREAEAFIRLSSFKKGMMIFVEVENSFNGKKVKKKNSGFPATEKIDKKAHGMGLMNIKKPLRNIMAQWAGQ
ncbi:MAG TPA: GHKL domain-containing protein [Thermoclostridium sp.]